MLANLKIWHSKTQPLSGNLRTDPLTSLMNMSLVLRLPRDMNLCRSSSNVPCLPTFLKLHITLTFCSLLARYRILCACHAKPHPNFQKWSEPVSFQQFWLRNVLRGTTACTSSTSQLPKAVQRWGALYILTSKCASCPNGALFQPLYLPKWTAFSVLTWKYASCHNGLHFFDISTSKSAPNMRCFVHFDFEMCSAPQLRPVFHLSSDQMGPHPPL